MDKIDRIIHIIRELKEEMMTTGSSGPVAGLSGSANPAGPTAGYDPVLGFARRKQIIGKGKYPGARKRWSKKKPLQ